MIKPTYVLFVGVDTSPQAILHQQQAEEGEVDASIIHRAAQSASKSIRRPQAVL